MYDVLPKRADRYNQPGGGYCKILVLNFGWKRHDEKNDFRKVTVSEFRLLPSISTLRHGENDFSKSYKVDVLLNISLMIRFHECDRCCEVSLSKVNFEIILSKGTLERSIGYV